MFKKARLLVKPEPLKQDTQKEKESKLYSTLLKNLDIYKNII